MDADYIKDHYKSGDKFKASLNCGRGNEDKISEGRIFFGEDEDVYFMQNDHDGDEPNEGPQFGYTYSYIFDDHIKDLQITSYTEVNNNYPIY